MLQSHCALALPRSEGANCALRRWNTLPNGDCIPIEPVPLANLHHVLRIPSALLTQSNQTNCPCCNHLLDVPVATPAPQSAQIILFFGEKCNPLAHFAVTSKQGNYKKRMILISACTYAMNSVHLSSEKQSYSNHPVSPRKVLKITKCSLPQSEISI